MGAVILGYSVAVYVFSWASLLYLAVFIGGDMIPFVHVPKTIDWGAAPANAVDPVLLNLALLALFGIQHSIMARPGFKRWLTRFVPEAAERSTFVLATVICLVLLYVYWTPMPGVVWSVSSPIWSTLLTAAFFAGPALVVVSTFLIDHFELFGLRQAWARFRGQPMPAPRFDTPSLYRFVRHPIYLGLLITFWATPSMSIGHLLLAAVWTPYLFVGLGYEERDLILVFGEEYRAYVLSTPTVLPFGRRT
jgi:protein-S-isoprenylcysteine O-methyltransferase Ste14